MRSKRGRDVGREGGREDSDADTSNTGDGLQHTHSTGCSSF